MNGHIVLAGNLRMMKENTIADSSLDEESQSLAKEGKTPLFFTQDGSLMGVIALADVIKPSSRQAVDSLKAMGIEGNGHRDCHAYRRQQTHGRSGRTSGRH